jgi:hypothetical protein
MSQLRVLEVVTALVFMFYAAALVSSGLVEWLANIVKKRAKYLLRGIAGLLEKSTARADLRPLKPTLVRFGSVGDEKALYRGALRPAVPAQAPQAPQPVQPVAKSAVTPAEIMSHPLVLALAQSDTDGTITRLPSYLSSGVFADSLLDLLGLGRNSSAAQVRAAIEGLDSGDLEKALSALLRAHGAEAEEFGRAIERWYDQAMDRVSGAYKRWSRRWLVVIALLIAFGMHLDAVGLAKNLWSDDTARAALVAAIDEAPDCTSKKDAEAEAECIDEVVEALASEGPPIGPQAWQATPDDLEHWLLLVLGLVLTGSAAALGAPFWFDALGRLNSLRNTGPKPARSET